PGPHGRGGRHPHPGSRRAQRARPAHSRDALRPGNRRPAARARRANPRLPQERRRRGALAPASLKTLGRAALLAVGATLIAAAVSLVGGASVTALDWSVYDRWLRSRAPVADTPRLVIVARDPSSEARFGARPVPAFGLALVSALTGPAAGDLRMAVDARGRTLVDFAGGAWPRGVQVVPFLEVWSAIEQGHADRIQTLANENAVLVVAEPTRATLRTPVGEMSPIAVQAHFARGLLAGSRLREASPVATAGVALALAALAAWVLSATRWWVGLAGAVVLAGAYAAALPMALATTGLVL